MKNPFQTRRIVAVMSLSVALGAGLAHAEPTTKPAAPVAAPVAGAVAAPVDNTAADKIIDRYIEVTGGKAAYDAIKSRRMTGLISIPAQNINGTLTISQKDATTALSTFEIPGLGKVIQGRRGDVVFEVNQLSNSARILEGKEAESTLRSLSLNETQVMRAHFTNRTVTGQELVEGKNADKVVLTAADGQSMTTWYEVDSGLAVKMETVMTTDMGEIKVASTMSDYKDFAGIKLPAITKQTFAGQEIIIKFNTIETNVEITDAEVALPEQVKTLVK